MYVYYYVVQSQKPRPIVTFDALYYPVDGYIWCFTVSSAIAVFLLLVIIQKCWNHASGRKPLDGWLFQGILSILAGIYRWIL